MKAKNKYSLPIHEGEFEKIDRTSSEAHAGKLKHAIDFKCDEGTPIHAALEGEVVFVRDNSKIGGPDKKYWFKGNRIVIKHKNKEYSAYEHFRYQGAKVKVGERVKTGQLICYSGNTGYTFGPHLHFEVLRFTGPDKDEDYETLEVKFQNYRERKHA
jgi:murein DD-endopeptidase MepM/ murein hydrolase activator NlpD